MWKIVFLALFMVVSADLENGVAYCSYHMYEEYQPLTQVSCSDGQNGLMTRWGYQNLHPMWPYVSAWEVTGWNSPKCGSCIKITWNNKSIYVTAIDQCGNPPAGHDAHFDISKPAFYELFGDEGIAHGTMKADWAVVGSNFCRGSQPKLQIQ